MTFDWTINLGVVLQTLGMLAAVVVIGMRLWIDVRILRVEFTMMQQSHAENKQRIEQQAVKIEGILKAVTEIKTLVTK